MKKSKLILFLKTLSSSEIKEWARYVYANSTKKPEDTLAFVNYLIQQHPEFQEKKISKEFITKKIYPDDPTNIKKIENMMYKCWSFLEVFLIHEELKQNKVESHFLLLNALRKRKLDKYFFKKIDELETKWVEESPSGINHLHDLFRLKKLKVTHPSFNVKINKKYDSNVLINSIEQYYLALKFRFTLSGLANKDYIKVIEDESITNSFPVKDLVNFSILNNKNNTIQVSLLSEIYTALTSNSTSINDTQLIMLMFFKNEKYFSKEEKADILSYLTLLFFAKYKEGEITALKYIFELNKFSVEKRVWVSKSTIAVDVFQNAVRVACAVNETEWAEDFINNNGKYLEDIQQKDTIVLAKASILLKQKRYSKILETLALVNFQNAFNSAFARATQLIAYFELEGYEELFYNHIKAFKLFLHRNTTLSVKHKKSFNNFISFAKRLKIAFTEYQPNVKQLEKNIIECNDILYQTWLLEKVSELKKELNC